jgi:ribosomal protein S18 acetylase RimI-like enzyme
MHPFHHITKISLVIPGQHISHMCHRLTQLQAGLESARGGESSLDERDRLAHLLGLRRWRTEWLTDGSLKLVEYTGTGFDPEHDSVLESAVGCVHAGCFIEGYGEENVQWQIRYAASSKQLVYGRVAFPRESEWERHFRSMLILREGRPSDLPQLAALSPIAPSIMQEQLLVAERGDRIVGFLTYYGEEERTGVITHIVTIVNGRRYGYPQALVIHLQQRYQALLIMTTKRDYTRVWKALGFARRSSLFEAGDPGVKEYYLWPAPAQEHAAPVRGDEELGRQLNVALLGLRGPDCLSEQESATLQWRFALRDGRWYSLEETARRVGTTREKARKHQANALHKLRNHPEFLALLKSYLRLASPPLRLRTSIAWLVQDPGTAPDHSSRTSEERRQR